MNLCNVEMWERANRVTKADIVAAAYGKYFQIAKDHIDENGYIRSNFWKEYNIDISYRSEERHIGWYRQPASLKGIETNNNWNRIDDVSDLPIANEEEFRVGIMRGLNWTEFGGKFKADCGVCYYSFMG